MRLQQRVMSYPRHIRPMETPSAGNIQSETPPSPGRPEDQQFARFLEAANQLGDHLDTIFTTGFTKILANASLTPHPVVQMKSARTSAESDDSFGKNVDRSSKKRKTSLGEETKHSPSPSLGMESSLVARLHFAEAMMVLMFNALSEPQQASIKQHFDDLLKRSENVEVVGFPSSTFNTYRNTLRAMENMLASNPTPEEMAIALAHDFAKRYRANSGGNAPNPPRSAG
jgi:hypothetical protein